MKTGSLVLVLALVGALLGAAGCSSKDPLENAAAPVTDTSKAVAPVQRERPHRAPPLAGPKAGMDIGGPEGK